MTTTVSAAQRVAALQSDARKVAAEHVQLIEDVAVELRSMLADVIKGGDAYHVGVREAYRSLDIVLAKHLATVTAIRTRAEPWPRDAA